MKRGAPGGASGRSRACATAAGKAGLATEGMGVTAFRAISRPFLIGRAFAGHYRHETSFLAACFSWYRL